MFFFCGKGKAGGHNKRLLADESIESCLTEECCSVDLYPVKHFILFCYSSDLSAVRKKVIVRISSALNLRLCV